MPPEAANALLLAAGIVALSFVAEDGATVLAVALAAGNLLPLEVAFLACFLGIWVGDIGLYAGARWLRGRAQSGSRLSRLAAPQRLARAEQWFRRRGTLALVLARFIPGTRTATYVAAGALRTPARGFAIATGLAAALWVAAAFALAHYAGMRDALSPTTTLTAAAALVLALFAGRALVRSQAAQRLHRTLRRWSRWEFWPAWLFYAPVVPMSAWLALRYRGLLLPSAANPAQRNGGIVGESKGEVLAELMRVAPEFTAGTYVIQRGPLEQRMEQLKYLLAAHEIGRPFVLKPDMGQRGAGFRKVYTREEALAYLAQVDAPVLLQRYAPGPHEAGIFYYRLPGESEGRIFAVTRKVFPAVVGDGERTLRELVLADERACLIADTYLRRMPRLAERVIPAGESIRLVEAGNHCQGCIFEDGRDLATEELRRALDAISRRLPGFFIGRYDVRYGSEKDLRAGRGFTIVELNGAAAEATSIYDRRNSLFRAYRTLYRQWELVYAIGAANRARGEHPAGLRALWRDWRAYQRQAAAYPAAD
jgi:membrane protein DedA with SNARE-associated domain